MLDGSLSISKLEISAIPFYNQGSVMGDVVLLVVAFMHLG